MGKDSTFIVDFGLASVSAAFGKSAIAPLERVKLLLQLQDASSQLPKDKHYKGIVDCLKRVHLEQGFLSFWRGNLANVIRYFPTQALSFAIRDLSKKHLPHYETDFQKQMLSNLAAGAIAGGMTTFVGYPLDFIRTRMGADVGKAMHEREFKSLSNCAVKVWKVDGVKGFFRGMSVALPGFALYRALYFGLYDSFKVVMPSESLIYKFMIAQGASTVGSVLCYPMDTVRRRMMMQSLRKDVLYSGVVDCTSKILKNEGVRALYKGGFTNILRSSGGALVLVLYDKLKQLLLIRVNHE